jgi:hypothetical protein
VADEAALNKGWKKCNKRLLNLSRGAFLDFLGETHEPTRVFFSDGLRVSFTGGKEVYGGGSKTIQGILVTTFADVMKEVFASEEIRRGSLQAFFDWGEGAREVDNLSGFPFCKRQDVKYCSG